MPAQLEIAVILTTYQRPGHLERSLLSLANQRGVDGKFEVIVADDGSTDRTPQVVQEFARTARFPLRWVTHPHDGFRVAFCRNEGVRASRASYFLFTDSDCVFPANHLQKHLLARRLGVVRAGDCFRFDQHITERIDARAIESGEFVNWVSRAERSRLFKTRIKGQYYQWIGHPRKPKLTGFNIGISREDFESVNGFDEEFVGWGCEDDDLAFRLRKIGRRITSVLSYTQGYHLWHPSDPSRPARWLDGPNVRRLDDLDRPARCAIGLFSNVSQPGSRSTSNQQRRYRAA